MANKWIALDTPTDVTQMHVDLLAHGWVVDVRHKDISCILHGQAGRARKKDGRVIIEEAIDDLCCIRTVYADTYCRVEMNDMSL